MKKLTGWMRSYSSLAAAVALALLGGTACDQRSRQGPTSPSVVAPSPTAVAPSPTAPAGPSNAVLVFRTLTARPISGSTPGQVWYELKVVLAETGGRSGASIATPVVTSPGNTDYGCAMLSRIEPGGTWDMDSLGYCAPGPFATATPTVTVSFTDDEGHQGVLRGTVDPGSLPSTAPVTN